MYRTTRQRRPRRTRFIATVSKWNSTKVEDVHVLDYDPISATLTLERHGYTVLDGPYPAKEHAQRKARQRKWSIDRAAVEAGFEAMHGEAMPSITLGIKTSTTQQGGFCVKPDGSLHLTVGGDNDRQRADEVLWHELCHLHQYMRHCARLNLTPGTVEAFVSWKAACRRERASRVGYLNRPKEREARTWEALAETDTLTKEA